MKAGFTDGTTRLVELLWLVVVIMVVDDFAELVVEPDGPLPRKKYNPPAATTTTKITAPTITALETAEDLIRDNGLLSRGQ